MTGILSQINVSAGGMPKTPLLLARVTKNGVEGDRQINLKYHGGPDRAACIFSEELYDWLATQGVNIGPGSVGENFTTRGIDLLLLAPGDRLSVGGCQIEITDVRIPCRQLNQWHPRLLQIIKGHSGWLAKVIVEGTVRTGDAIALLPRAKPD